MWSKVNIRIALLAPNSSVTHSLINYVDEIWRKRHCPTGAKKKKKNRMPKPFINRPLGPSTKSLPTESAMHQKRKKRGLIR